MKFSRLITDKILLWQETGAAMKMKTSPTNSNMKRKKGWELTLPWERLHVVHWCCERERSVWPWRISNIITVLTRLCLWRNAGKHKMFTLATQPLASITERRQMLLISQCDSHRPTAGSCWGISNWLVHKHTVNYIQAKLYIASTAPIAAPWTSQIFRLKSTELFKEIYAAKHSNLQGTGL